MKHIYFIFSILCLGQISSFAQTIEFAPEGSVWKYQRQEGGWGPPVIDYVEVRYTDNILVDSILCKRLVAPEGDYYIYQDGDRVYHRRDTASQFKLLWDFGVMPGDSFLIYSNSAYAPEREIKFVCTGRDTILENNMPLPRINLTMYCGGTWVQPITVNPRYGPMYDGHCPDYMFNSYNYCIIDVGYGFTLLNYSDNTFATVINCSVSTTDLGAPPNISTAPNPTTGWVQLLGLPNDATIHCYDTFGRLVTVPSDSSNFVDLSSCPKGVYILDLRVSGQSFQRVKVIKI
jgi:hypothetical protein